MIKIPIIIDVDTDDIRYLGHLALRPMIVSLLYLV